MYYVVLTKWEILFYFMKCKSNVRHLLFSLSFIYIRVEELFMKYLERLEDDFKSPTQSKNLVQEVKYCAFA